MTVLNRSFRAYCLENEPRSIGQLQFPDTLPGEVYDADMQCKLQFGSHSKLCISYGNRRNICKALWCQKNGRECETKFLPAAEGTECGRGMWCRRGRCVNQAELGPKPVSGGWGAYSNWSSCSRSCNGGVSYRERKCDNPRPSNGGQYCKGEDKAYKSCNTQVCPTVNPNFIQQHCNVFNSKAFKGKRYKWKLYHRDLGALSRCRAYCVPETADINLVLSTKLTDGVKCRPGGSAICINGECRNMGCDGIVESDAKPDMCGVCGGSNATCRLVRGNLSEVASTAGYHEVMKIEKGARNIVLIEAKESPAYFSIRNASGHYYISGKWPGRYRFSGTEFVYRRWRGQREMLKSRGPTEEELIWELLSSTPTNTSLHYEYVVPIKQSQQPSLHKHSLYRWMIIKSSCSTTCGLGIQTLTPVCYDSLNDTVSDSMCSNAPRPLEKEVACNNTTCPPAWKASPWSRCDCKRRFQYRQVNCVRSVDGTHTERLSRNNCLHLAKPGRKKKCKKEKCIHTNWTVGPWSICHGDCSWGVQTRLVVCNKSSENIKARCDSRRRPPSVRYCKVRQCHKGEKRSEMGMWLPGKWSKCSATCGSGMQTREVRCSEVTLPEKYGYYKGRSNSSAEGNCELDKKPSISKTCNGPPCTDSVCSDLYGWCHIVVKHGVCQRKLYSKKCCLSCKRIQHFSPQ